MIITVSLVYIPHLRDMKVKTEKIFKMFCKCINHLFVIFFADRQEIKAKKQRLYINACMESRAMVQMNLFAGQE